MRRTLLPLLAFTSLAVGAAEPALAAQQQRSTRGLVAITDQQNHQILLLDAARSWNDPAAVRWTWRPPAGTPGWQLPTDARLRRTAHSGLVMLTTDSAGYVGEVAYPAGRVLWSVNAGGPANPHTAELLPDGNVAVAASDGDWIRIYTASQGGALAAHYTQLGVPQAHGLLWDSGRKVLWALDQRYVLKLRVAGSTAAPRLTVLSRSRLPDPDGGHDIQPVLGDDRKLWVATGTHVYQFDTSTRRFTTHYAGAAQINRFAVKSIGQNPATGQLIETTPKPSCPVGDWCTDTVTLWDPAVRRTRPGAAIYKARWWSPSST